MDAACDLKKGDFDARLTFDRTETGSYFKAAGQPHLHGTLTGRCPGSREYPGRRQRLGAQVDLTAFHLQYSKTSR
jgi:hypothetical protein